MKRGGQFQERIRQFMAGRYGADQLSRFLSIGSCVFIILSLFTRSVGGGALSSLLASAAFAALIWCYIRILSRKFEQRQRENLWYLKRRDKVVLWFNLQRDRFRQRKDYVFFRCPSCKSVARVPRHKGHIRITCRHCGYTFEKKT